TEEAMSDSSEGSPEEPLGTETFEQGDEALDEASRLDARTIERVGQDRALDWRTGVGGIWIRRLPTAWTRPSNQCAAWRRIEAPLHKERCDTSAGRLRGEFEPTIERPF